MIFPLKKVRFALSRFPEEDVEVVATIRRASCQRSCVIHLQLVYFYPGDRVMRQLGMVQTIPSPPTVWDSRGTRSTTLPYRVMIAWQNRMQEEYVVHGEPITADTPFPWMTIEYRDWFGSPRIYNPWVIFDEQRPIPSGYMEPLYEDLARRSVLQCHTIEAALGDPNSDPRFVLQSTLNALRASPPPYIYALYQESSRPQVPERVRRKGRSRRASNNEDDGTSWEAGTSDAYVPQSSNIIEDHNIFVSVEELDDTSWVHHDTPVTPRMNSHHARARFDPSQCSQDEAHLSSHDIASPSHDIASSSHEASPC